jgi:hypothetical protein
VVTSTTCNSLQRKATTEHGRAVVSFTDIFLMILETGVSSGPYHNPVLFPTQVFFRKNTVRHSPIPEFLARTLYLTSPKYPPKLMNHCLFSFIFVNIKTQSQRFLFSSNDTYWIILETSMVYTCILPSPETTCP